MTEYGLTPALHTEDGGSLVEVIERVLDKGIVIDAWVRLSVVGVDLITVETRVVVASIETYLHYADALGAAAFAARPIRSEKESPPKLGTL